MVGVKKTKPLERWALWRQHQVGGLQIEPAVRYGVKLMSVALLLGEEQTFAWPAQMIDFVGRQFLTEVDWGDLDYLVIDLQPGTGDYRSWRQS
jgi:Mrp family chromosome partitioning ATPase